MTVTVWIKEWPLEPKDKGHLTTLNLVLYCKLWFKNVNIYMSVTLFISLNVLILRWSIKIFNKKQVWQHCCWGLRPLYGWTGCWIIGQTPLRQWLEVIIARLDSHGEYRWSNWPRYVGTWFAPPSTPDFSGEVGLNLALGMVTTCRRHKWKSLKFIRRLT